MMELIQRALDTIQEHISGGYAWAPYGAAAVLLLGGLLTLWRGARLMTLLCAAGFTALGGVAGATVATRAAIPVWPTALIAAAAGLIIGWLLVRIMLALFLAGGVATAALVVYYVRVLAPLRTQYAMGTDMAPISVPEAGKSLTVLGGLVSRGEWEYLASNAGHLQMSIIAIAVSTALAGLACGLLLPSLSRALVAATAGVVAVAAAVFGLLQLSGHSVWLANVGREGWYVIGAIWLLAVIYNLFDERRRHAPTKTVVVKAAAAPAGAKAAPASS